MRTISYKLDDLKKIVIPIGYEGENNHTRVIIDAGEVFKQYPEAAVALTVQPPKGTMYPAIVTRDGDAVTWDVKDSDCASNGNGEAQFTFTNGTVVVKSVVTKIKVQRSLHTEGPAPDPILSWLDTASETLEEADQAIEAATEAAAAAEAAAEDLKALDDITKAALAGDVGKALSPKTVENGVVTEWQFVEPGAGTDDYTDLDNKPSIAGVTLSGNKTLEDLGIAAADDLNDVAEDVSRALNAIQGKYTLPSGGIPDTDLSSGVQTLLGLADTAYQKPSGGIPATDIADGVIPVVDSTLSDSSENAVQNKVVKGALDGKAPLIINTVTGNPAVFNDGCGMPIKSLLVYFTPKQTGSGDPSPSNIRPIIPWEGLTVFGGGINQFDGQMEIGTYNGNTGEKSSNPTRLRNVNPIKVKAGANYRYISNRQTEYGVSWLFYKKDGTFISNNNRTNTLGGFNIPVPADAYYMNISPWDNYGTVYGNDIGINYPSTETAYEPYHPITDTDIVFPSPVYGGTLDVVSGVLTVEWAGFSATWGDGKSATDMGSGITRKVFPMVDYLQTGPANNMCNIALYGAYEDAYVHFYYSGSGSTNRKCRLFLPSDTPDSTEITVITKLSQTYEVQLTGEQITALVGDNTIWSDADGQLTVEYPADTKTYINNLIATAIASL